MREPTLHTYQPAVLHGDLSPDHFLADTEQARLTGVIDWGDARIGDPAWDLVYIYEDYGPRTLNAFLDHYDRPNAHLLEHKVRLYQQLNNMDYCLAVLSNGSEEQVHEALALLEEQAITGGA
jgi:aminoglycoside 2''-phosphotransferase